MKKEVLLIILSLILLGCTTPETPVENIAKPVVETSPPEPQVSEEAEIIEGPAAPIEAAITRKKHDLIFPTLSYENAYNGPLYGTSEQVGSVSMDTYFQLLDKNGINYFIGMFSITGEPAAETLIANEGLGKIIAAAQKHPSRIIPFFNPGIGGEKVEQYLGEELTGMYAKTVSASQKIVGKEFIRGLGEIETQEWSVRHNDPKVLELIDLAQRNGIIVMFHPVASKADDVQKIIESYPDTLFLIHLYREDLTSAQDKWISLLQEHNNLYFSMDAAHIIHLDGDVIYEFDSSNKDASVKKFVSFYNSNEKKIISNAIRAYKPFVDAAPDKIMWGTEIGPEYAFEPAVFDRAVKASRLVIAGFDKEHQDAVGYKNALRVFGEGAVADANINVRDTSSWPDCSNSQMSACDESCNIPDTDSLTAGEEACYQDCIIKKQCKEVVEMDVG